jgi:hypothetical protein
MSSKNTPYPGYKTEKPIMEPIKDLFDELGAQDACIQLQELSITHLKEKADEKGDIVGDFLNEMYKENGIPQGTHDFNDLRLIASRSYLITTHAIFEKMLREIIKDCKIKTKSKWVTNTDKGENFAALQELIENLPKEKKINLTIVPEYKLLEYYRYVRVANSHRKNDTSKKADKAYSSFSKKDFDHFKSYAFAPKAPNPPEHICFSDFLLFTRAIKYYSKLLNEHCALSA